jgi:hypothetical protein
MVSRLLAVQVVAGSKLSGFLVAFTAVGRQALLKPVSAACRLMHCYAESNDAIDKVLGSGSLNCIPSRKGVNSTENKCAR